MRRIVTFAIGMLVGGALLYTTLQFHIVRSADGLHLVRKNEAQLAGTYVDIRGFAPVDWVRRPEIAAALMRADRADLIESTATDALSDKLDELFPIQEKTR